MTEQTQQAEECMAATGPGAEHEKLEPFVGTFKAEVKLWMGPGDPHVTTGTMVNEWILGGRFLEQTYTGDAMEGPSPDFKGRGFWGYNTSTNQYEGVWIDTASTALQTETGAVDASGKVWTMIGEAFHPQMGGTITKKSVITLSDDTHHSMEMFFLTPDGNEMKCMEITYVRA
ncbi:MAG: DUF1579 domain-containing protein [Planctomycetota bacterium]|jgi:hypothetical protein